MCRMHKECSYTLLSQPCFICAKFGGGLDHKSLQQPNIRAWLILMFFHQRSPQLRVVVCFRLSSRAVLEFCTVEESEASAVLCGEQAEEALKTRVTVAQLSTAQRMILFLGVRTLLNHQQAAARHGTPGDVEVSVFQRRFPLYEIARLTF